MPPLQPAPELCVSAALGAPTAISGNSGGRVSWERQQAQWVCSLRALATARPQLPHPYTSFPVTRRSPTVHLPLRNCLSSSQGCRYSAPNPTMPLFSFWGPLLALGGRDGGSSEKVGGGGQAPGLCFLSGGEGCYIEIVGALLYLSLPQGLCPISGFSHIIC